MKKRSAIKKINILFLPAAAALFLSACTGEANKYELREEAVALYNAGDYEGAVSKFDEALAASDGQVSELQIDILRYKAECQLRIGKLKDAKTSYEALMVLDEDNAEYVSHYNDILSELDALSGIEEAGRLFDAGSYEAAAQIYRQYAALDGTLSGKAAWYNLAAALEYMGEYGEAYELFSDYLNVYPDDEAAIKEAEFSRSRMAGEE